MSALHVCRWCEGTGQEGPVVPAMGLYLGRCSFCNGTGTTDRPYRPHTPAPMEWDHHDEHHDRQSRLADLADAYGHH